jgi:pimeloyl-ACP methyl ester carboxylesterase
MKLARLLPLLTVLISHQVFADWNYQTVEGAGGVPLNVVTSGDPGSPAILFVHGIGQSHYSFVRQLDSTLADDFFLVSFDLRGHGASGKPWTDESYNEPRRWAEDVAAVIAATELDQPVVVAWSYGTLVVMDYVREFGIDGLAGINLTGALGALRPFRMPTGEDPNAEKFAQLRELQRSPDLADNIRASDEFTKWLTAAPLPDSEHELFYAISVMLPAYARRGMMNRQFDNQDLEAKLTLPLLLSLGEHDNPGQLIDGAEMAAAHDNVSLSEYKESGHSVFFEDPERYNSELRQFVMQARSLLNSP